VIVALFPHSGKSQSYSLATSIREFLTNHHVTVVSPDEDAHAIGANPLSSTPLEKIDVLLSMGGDGTILGLVHQYPTCNAAILGINLGHLGFMADIPLSDLYPSLQDLINGVYTIEERLMIQGEAQQQKPCFAVNDIVIHRATNPSLIELAIHIDGLHVNTFEADGLIIATPNGSTAYSLAAGGPILSPTLEAIVITPVCPHTISNRPIVITPHQELQIQYLSPYDPVDVCADGIAHHTLHTGDTFRIRRSPKNFRFLNLLRRDYFSVLRTKLGWSGKLR